MVVILRDVTSRFEELRKLKQKVAQLSHSNEQSFVMVSRAELS
jgi:hypothetical protein